MTSGLPMTISDVEDAAARIAGRVLRTPVVPIVGTDYLAKCENLQRTGAFKIRGATNAVLSLQPDAVVTASSGNHGYALAAAARDAGIPATIVMPLDASPYKRSLIEALGAFVVPCGPETSAREAMTEQIASETGAVIVPPYNHPLVMAGQGTVGLEIADDVPDVRAVVVPVGGGGLISGVATAVKARTRGVRVIGVEPEAGDDFVRSRVAGERIGVPVPQTICDGARTQMPGELTWQVVEALVDDIIAVPDERVVNAMRLLAGSGLWVEPTGALSVAGALELGLGASTVCVVSGRNIAPPDLFALLSK